MKPFRLLLSIPCLSLILILMPFISSCGGGGGGDEFIGAALVSMQASPTQIDTADRMLIQVDVREVNDSGIALKFKFPLGLSYVPSSSSLVVENESLDITPAVNVAENNFRFLVYYLDQSTFGKGNNGRVEFLLEGVTRVIDGNLEVDADVDNPLIDNGVEFDPANPGFAAEDTVLVNVEG